MDNLRLGPIGQIARPVSDVGRAAELVRHRARPAAPLYLRRPGVLRLRRHAADAQRAEAAIGAGAPSVLYFRVGDIQAAYDELRSRGVEFVGAPHMIFKHPDGVEEWMAFFTRPGRAPARRHGAGLTRPLSQPGTRPIGLGVGMPPGTPGQGREQFDDPTGTGRAERLPRPGGAPVGRSSTAS